MNTQLSIIQAQSSFFMPTLQNFSNMIVENANDGVELSMVDFETVENIDNALVAAHGLSRSCLYWMREKKGYLILGFESFEKYGEARFGFSRQHLNRLADAHAIQKVIEPIGANSISKEIKESVLRPLKEVPDEIKKQIWEEAKAEHEKVTAKIIEEKVASYKAENEQLQKSLLDANEKVSGLTSTVNDIVENAVKEVETEMQARFDAIQDKLSKAINDKVKLENQIKESGSSLVLSAEQMQNAQAELQKLNREIEAQQARKEELTIQFEHENNDLRINGEISDRCFALREAIGMTFAELAGVRGVAKNLFEETNAQIHGTAEMLEEFARQLRQYATDNAEFEMITA